MKNILNKKTFSNLFEMNYPIIELTYNKDGSLNSIRRSVGLSIAKIEFFNNRKTRVTFDNGDIVETVTQKLENGEIEEFSETEGVKQCLIKYFFGGEKKFIKEINKKKDQHILREEVFNLFNTNHKILRKALKKTPTIKTMFGQEYISLFRFKDNLKLIQDKKNG